MKLSCEEVRDLLALHVEGALEPEEADALRSHLLACEACRREERAERAAWRALGALPGVAVPSGFSARVARAARPWWKRPVPLAAAASFVLALVAGALTFLPSKVPDEDVIAHLDLLEQWTLLADEEIAVALEAPEEELLPLGAENGG